MAESVRKPKHDPLACCPVCVKNPPARIKALGTCCCFHTPPNKQPSK